MQVADALKERAERIYKQYGNVMMDVAGMSKAGIDRKATCRGLFSKLLYLAGEFSGTMLHWASRVLNSVLCWQGFVMPVLLQHAGECPSKGESPDKQNWYSQQLDECHLQGLFFMRLQCLALGLRRTAWGSSSCLMNIRCAGKPGGVQGGAPLLQRAE